MDCQSLISNISTSRVSSVLNRDVKQFGKKHLFNGDDETCWNSDQGMPQWVLIDFNSPVDIEEIHIQFQGGFAGKDCYIEDNQRNINNKNVDFYPEDINSLQVFKMDVKEVQSMRIVFTNSTDFFGRITIYKLDVLGRKIS